MTAKRSVPWLAAGLLALSLAAAGAYHLWWRSHPPAPVSAPLPPLTTSPFLNTKPGVAYVGDQACAGCHRDECSSYRQHPMGRSLFTAADAPPLEQYEGANNPLQAGRFHFQVLRQGSRLIHKEWCQDAGGNPVAEVETDIAYVVGSGSQARSYICQRDGFLFQSPISWFTQNAEWHLSPGYEETQRHFSRRIDPRCLYCHCQEAHPVADTMNRYREPVFGQLAIGCERCHGPGELHVASRNEALPREKVDATIVNPRHLEPALRDAVCEQCHLQGEAIVVRRGRAQTDYRPGLPLHEYVSIFVRAPETADASRIVSHAEQMHLSACFRKSDGKFGCISCHDAHAAPVPDEKVTVYRDRCLKCHGPTSRPADEGMVVKAPGCSLPAAERTAQDARDNCLTCHMPRNPSSNVTHFAVTDHRVLRRPGRPARANAKAGAGDVPLVAFHRQLLRPDDEELPRDLGLALTSLAVIAHDSGADQLRNYLSRRAQPLLDKATTRAPDDLPALEARGFVLFTQGQFEEALKALEGALAKAPDREETLTLAADVAEAKDQLDLAEKYCRRLVEKYPQLPEYHHRLAVILVKREAWRQALEAAQTAVRGDPFRAESRAVLITALLEMGDRVRAQAEFDVLGAVDPDYQNKLRPWFAERLKQTK